jgi:Na+/H+-translocating membrane pyrophosphatase
MTAYITQLDFFLGAILSLIVGLAGMWVALKNSRWTNYINSLTTPAQNPLKT